MGFYIGVPSYSAMQGPCPEGFHVPTSDEWVELATILNTTFGLAKGSATMATYLKIPTTGVHSVPSSSVSTTQGYYWSCTNVQYTATSGVSKYMNFTASNTTPDTVTGNLYYGMYIRPFKDLPVMPKSSWTTLYDGSSVATGAGIFWDSTNGLISASGDGSKWITIADKNLGATSSTAAGNYYQWGNNYGFSTASETTSSTKVDASGYGPGNYYSSSTFITSGPDWSSVWNPNLWGFQTGVTGTVKELYKAYIGEPGGREPGANTIAYFPLKNDILDQTGNLTLTYNSLTKNTGIGYIVTGGAKVTTNGAVYYMGGWCNVQSGSEGYTNICSGDNPEMGYYFHHAGSASGDTFLNQACYVAYNSSFDASTVPVTILTNTWHHYAISYEGGKSCVYIDGVKKLEYNGIGYNFGNMAYLFSSRPLAPGAVPNSGTSVAIISDYILESVGRTAQEILNYYNQTKGNYGIS